MVGRWSVTKDLMSLTRDASWSCLCSAVLRHGGGGGASAQHSTALHNWPNAIQCLGSDDIMSLGIKSFATEGVGTKKPLQRVGRSCS